MGKHFCHVTRVVQFSCSVCGFLLLNAKMHCRALTKTMPNPNCLLLYFCQEQFKKKAKEMVKLWQNCALTKTMPKPNLNLTTGRCGAQVHIQSYDAQMKEMVQIGMLFSHSMMRNYGWSQKIILRKYILMFKQSFTHSQFFKFACILTRRPHELNKRVQQQASPLEMEKCFSFERCSVHAL